MSIAWNLNHTPQIDIYPFYDPLSHEKKVGGGTNDPQVHTYTLKDTLKLEFYTLKFYTLKLDWVILGQDTQP